MHTFPLLATFPDLCVCVCVCVSRCAHVNLLFAVGCVRARSCALIHLELELSALRNVDINQSHREWCGLEFLSRIILHTHTHTH